MTEHRHYSGPDLAPLLRQVRDELGSDAEIIRAERIRTGGLAGFFAREHYEVVAKRPKVDLSASMEPPTGPHELVGSNRTNVAPTQAPTPFAAGPATVEPTAAAGGSGRSIQAALLDRADRVSTEELLVRVAETHSAEWGSESFQTILGRAMVDAVDPTVDRAVSPSVGTASIEDRRREPAPVDIGPDRADETIGGLRLETIRPGENVIDPAPQKPPAELSAGERGARYSERADGGPPTWDQHWMPGWAPWMGNDWSNGWPAHVAGDTISGEGPHLLCANCADSCSADGDDHRPSPSTLERGTTENPEMGDPWSELRGEIDDVRLRLDDIIATMRQATADENFDCGREPTETELDDHEDPTSDCDRTDR